MKPTTVAELREAIEHEYTQIPRELFLDMCDSIASIRDVSSVWIKMDVSLRTGSEKNNKMILVNIFTFLK